MKQYLIQFTIVYHGGVTKDDDFTIYAETIRRALEKADKRLSAIRYGTGSVVTITAIREIKKEEL